jgi:hypothetical protein
VIAAGEEDVVRVILAGAYTVTAGDDGFKSDNEEDEGRGWVLLNGGTLNVTAGSQAGGMGGGETVGDYTVEISGGSLTINSQGDGLDSNGNATISGGTVVNAPPTTATVPWTATANSPSPAAQWLPPAAQAWQ